MDYRERFANYEDSLRLAFRGILMGTWTAMPGIIQNYEQDANAKITATIQLALSAVIELPSGQYQNQNYPPLIRVPVVFPRGGGCSLTFPLAQGDEVLVIFASRCIDSWWQQGGVNNITMDARTHDLSDGFAIPGPWSQPQANNMVNLSTTTTQLRTNDGQTYIEINPTNHSINLKTSGNLTATISGTLTANVTGNSDITTPTLTVHGNLQVNGTIDATQTITTQQDLVTSVVTSLNTHVHGGVQSGGSNTTGPTG